MQITDEKVKKNFVIRALKQIGTFFSNDTNALNSKKEDLTKSNEDLQNKLNSLNKEIKSLN